MKKIVTFLTLGIMILTVTNCSVSTKIFGTDDMIPFKKNYISKKGTNLTFTDIQVLKVKMFNEAEINLSGNLFSENLDVKEDGKGYVINPALDKLSTIPAGSEWKVSSIERNPTNGSTTLMMTCTLPSGIIYKFPFMENFSNSMFYVVPSATGFIN